MSYTYDQRKRPQGPQNTSTEPATTPGTDLRALMTGAARPTAAQKGRSIDLDAAMKAKMEHVFGDLSAVKLYESKAVGEAGAEAIAQGNEIAFAPGMTDFNTRSGQERLGHELSHVMSQRSGQVRGRGFLTSSALEARADREGAMAAAGEQVFTGPVASSLTSASPSPAIAGPMQAKKYKETNSAGRAYYDNADEIVNEGEEGYKSLDPTKWTEITRTPTGLAKIFGKTKRFKAKINRRPWEMSREELAENKYNPNNLTRLSLMDQYLDTMDEYVEDQDPQTRNGAKNRKAWQVFQIFSSAGTNDIKTETGEDWDMNEMDHGILTAKLKNMSRMVSDYPELAGNIGTLERIPKQKPGSKPPAPSDKEGKQPPKKKGRDRKRQKKTEPQNAPENDSQGGKPAEGRRTATYMSTSPTYYYPEEVAFDYNYRGMSAFPLRMNSKMDAVGEKARKNREDADARQMKNHSQSAEKEYSGNHELGHMLNYLLVKERYRNLGHGKRLDKNEEDFHFQITAHELVEQALKDTMDPDAFNSLTRYKESTLAPHEARNPGAPLGEDEEWGTKDDEKPHKRDMINFKASNLGGKEGDRGYTSGYGASSAAEFFAEAFADVYRNGTEARPTSIRLVQLYEEKMAEYKKLNR